MIVKIALIGSAAFCQRTEQLVAKRIDIQLDYYRYSEPKEAVQLIHTLKPSDAILFSGSLPYLFAEEVLEKLPIPVLYLQQDETAVALTLLRFATQEKLNLNRISIDVRDQSSIETIINELGPINLTPFVHVLKDQEAIVNIVDFHTKLFIEGKTDRAITSVHTIYEQLSERKIPAMRMIDPASSILKTIELAKQQAILQKSDAAQIAIGIVTGNVDHLETLVKQIAHLMQANWNEQQNRYILFTTKGNIEFVLKNGAFNRLFESVVPNIKVAFGYGESMIDATENAQTALDFVENNKANAFYIVNAHKKLQGPFPQSSNSVEMKVHEPALVEMVSITKLSPTNISRLLSFGRSRQANRFSANDLALSLNVTRRTAERTLKKLLEFDYVRIVGEEMTYRQGRPRSLYEFNFPIY